MATTPNVNKAENVKLGVCIATFGGSDLGFTKGGVEVAVESETHEVTVDQNGSAPINAYIMGRTVKVTVPLAETTLENLITTMPGAKLITDTVDPNKKYVSVPTGVGLNLLDFAKELVLHPKAKPAEDKTDDFTVFRAATPGAMTYSFTLDQERIFNVEFTGYPNDKGTLFAVGDTTALGN